jgi:Domain of unknown function (DUF4838)
MPYPVLKFSGPACLLLLPDVLFPKQIMVKKVIPAFVFFLLLSALNPSNAQVDMYANQSDSISIVIKRLTGELEKAGFRKGQELKPESFKETGFLFLQTSEADKLKIKYPASLKTFGPEGVYIKANNKSVQFIGNTVLALQQAVYLYLEQLGYRYLLPGEIWNVVPKLNSAYKALTILTRPDFDHRRISNGHGYGGSSKIVNDFEAWASANLLGGAFQIKVGHSYDEIVTGNIETFKQHPEYFAQAVTKGNVPPDPKFNVANKELVQLVLDDAVKRMEQFKKWGWNLNMISMEPSDGGGFCTSPACKAIGTASEQVYYLTNEVAKLMQKKYPGTWVGGFAYNEHILPPKFKMEPNVFLMVTNGFNRTKYNTVELLNMWRGKISKVGLYEYMSVYEWDNDIPGQVPTAKMDWLKRTIPYYYKNGVRAYLGESVMGWINKGPGQYVASKMLWNVKVKADSVYNDFFRNAFENVAPQMRKLYDTWENYPHKVPVESDMANWFAWVDDAYNKAGSELIRKRIQQVKIYLHYVAEYVKLKKNPTEENMQKMLRFAYRNFETAAFATLPAMVSLPTYTGYQLLGWYASPDQQWKKDNRPYSDEEINKMFSEDKKGMKPGALLNSYPITGKFIKLGAVTDINKRKFPVSNHTTWGETDYVVRVNKKGASNFFSIYSGMAANPDVARNVEIKFYRSQTPLTDPWSQEKPVLQFEQSKKGAEEQFSLQQLDTGTYFVKVNDQQKMFVLAFSEAVDFSFISRADKKVLTTSSAGLNIFYFYVPKGVKSFRVIKSVVVKLGTPANRIIDFANNKEEALDVEVKPGEDDGVWVIFDQAGSLYLEGVPPYLGVHPSRMLVPSYLKK